MVSTGTVVVVMIVIFTPIIYLYLKHQSFEINLTDIAKNESCVERGMNYFELEANPNYEFCRNGSKLFLVKFECDKDIYIGKHKCNFTEVDLR